MPRTVNNAQCVVTSDAIVTINKCNTEDNAHLGASLATSPRAGDLNGIQTGQIGSIDICVRDPARTSMVWYGVLELMCPLGAHSLLP